MVGSIFAVGAPAWQVKPVEPPGASDQPAKTPPPPEAPGANADADANAKAQARIEAILEAMEKAGRDIRDIRCRIELTDEDEVAMSTTNKQGRILFLKADPNPMFLVIFDRVEKDGRASKQQSRTWYLFNGLSLLEAHEREKHIVEREVVKPGEKVDFFDMDKAPFPLPFGQKKDKILSNFTVKLAKPGPGDPDGSDHLICTPKPKTRMERRYRRLEFFVQRETELPCRIVAVTASGYQKTRADFPDLSKGSINTGLTVKSFAEPKEWSKQKYTRDVEPLREAEPRPSGSVPKTEPRP